MTKIYISLFLITFSLSSCNNKSGVSNNNTTNSIPIIEYKYIQSYPHDTTSFTEGFFINKGKLYESTGAPKILPQTKSLLGIVDLTTGEIEIKVEIDRKKYFGEGIAFLNEKIYQLTYKTNIGFIYDANTFKKIGDFTFPSKEGWGLTTDGTNLIMSDGTCKLTYIDPTTFKIIKKIPVTVNGHIKTHLNELEYIKSYVFANIWPTNTIVKINPIDGKVLGELDLTCLFEECREIFSGSMEMNGIAYDSSINRIFVTGKLWPRIYEMEID